MNLRMLNMMYLIVIFFSNYAGAHKLSLHLEYVQKTAETWRLLNPQNYYNSWVEATLGSYVVDGDLEHAIRRWSLQVAVQNINDQGRVFINGFDPMAKFKDQLFHVNRALVGAGFSAPEHGAFWLDQQNLAAETIKHYRTFPRSYRTAYEFPLLKLLEKLLKAPHALEEQQVLLVFVESGLLEIEYNNEMFVACSSVPNKEQLEELSQHRYWQEILYPIFRDDCEDFIDAQADDMPYEKPDPRNWQARSRPLFPLHKYIK